MDTPQNLTEDSIWIYYDKMADPRTKGWLLVDSPIELGILILGYYSMVYWGPRIMAKRQKFQLRKLLIAYNFLMVLLNIYILRDVLVGTSKVGYNYLCDRGYTDNNPNEIKILNAMWWYYFSKFIEFADTLFFILRKKNDQLSQLHVYHHSTMAPISWIGVKWFPSGAMCRLSTINCFIHVLMYSYYGLSALGPNVQKFLWWKKYITRLQMIQFGICMTWAVHALLCCSTYPSWILFLNIFYMLSFLVLFGNFYVKKYTKKIAKLSESDKLK